MPASRTLMLLAALTAAGLSANLVSAQPVQPEPTDTGPVGPVLAAAPSLTITNGLITAHIAPDGPWAFYHGTRFDQTGVVTSLVYRGQEFYGPWFERVSKQVLDYAYLADGSVVAGPDSAISGPAEEFAPLGYDATPPGGNFLKIGVGALRRPDDKPYDHYRLYTIADAGARVTSSADNSVSFAQTVSAGDYGYAYEKTVRLVPGKPQMMIEHRLRNTGSQPIVTTVYDHNFASLSPGNAGVTITMPFTGKTANPPPAELATLDGRRITFHRALTGRERASMTIAGFGPSAKDYDFSVANQAGAAIRIAANQPLADIHFFAIRTTSAIEPYIAINLAPGAEKRWTYTYTYTAPKR